MLITPMATADPTVVARLQALKGVPLSQRSAQRIVSDIVNTSALIDQAIVQEGMPAQTNWRLARNWDTSQVEMGKMLALLPESERSAFVQQQAQQAQSQPDMLAQVVEAVNQIGERLEALEGAKSKEE